jgi:hypothetical protein
MGWQFNEFIYFDNELGYYINMDYMVFPGQVLVNFMDYCFWVLGLRLSLFQT